MAAPNSLILKTQDGIAIHGRHWSRANRAVFLIMPGYAQHSGSGVMQSIAEDLAVTRDVLCLDPRGNGRSDGRFQFGANEWRDVEAALRWASEHYDDVSLLGFSLGAYSSLRTCVEGAVKPDRLFLVSCPTKFQDIVFKGHALHHGFKALAHPLLLKKERYPFFRWGNPLRSKPSASDLACRLEVPVSFLVGAEDKLVPPSMSRAVYDQVAGEKKWLELARADHAEFIFESHPVECGLWVDAF